MWILFFNIPLSTRFPSPIFLKAVFRFMHIAIFLWILDKWEKHCGHYWLSLIKCYSSCTIHSAFEYCYSFPLSNIVGVLKPCFWTSSSGVLACERHQDKNLACCSVLSTKGHIEIYACKWIVMVFEKCSFVGQFHNGNLIWTSLPECIEETRKGHTKLTWSD